MYGTFKTGTKVSLEKTWSIKYMYIKVLNPQQVDMDICTIFSGGMLPCNPFPTYPFLFISSTEK
jgi:hypothetical protein